MRDTIYRDDAIKAFDECLETSECGTMLSDEKYLDHLKAIPSADRPQGEWIKPYGDSRFMCSICKGKENVPTCMGKPSVWDYCPNCGARMKGADNE